MRTWTLAVSIVFHLTVIAGVIVTPLLATGELPPIPRAAPEYVLVVARMPPVPPAPRQPSRTESSTAAPVTPPDRVMPDTRAPETPSRPTDFDVVGGDPTAGPFVPTGDGGGDVPPPPLTPPTPPAPIKPIRVSGLQAPKKITDVAPRYPAIALAARKEGVVILEAVIGEDGSVENVQVLRSVALLDQAAVEAVQQWRFTPTLLGGQPVPVVMTVTVSFNLK